GSARVRADADFLRCRSLSMTIDTYLDVMHLTENGRNRHAEGASDKPNGPPPGLPQRRAVNALRPASGSSPPPAGRWTCPETPRAAGTLRAEPPVTAQHGAGQHQKRPITYHHAGAVPAKSRYQIAPRDKHTLRQFTQRKPPFRSHS